MIYNAIGIMSGSALDGLDICYAQFVEKGGHWAYEILHTDCVPYTTEWTEKLTNATKLSAYEYQLLHCAYGHYIGKQINNFIDKHKLHYKVAIIGSHGHTSFHAPHLLMTAQLGDGAAIVAETGIAVVSDLRAIDVALGGQGAPIVPIGEKYLLGHYDFFVNLGGIANISCKHGNHYVAYDTSPANKVLNMLMQTIGKPYDDNGALAATGVVNLSLLDELNGLDYYALPYPKSLPNCFGTEVILPIITKYALPLQDALNTYCEHIAIQLQHAVKHIIICEQLPVLERSLLITGGGAFNHHLINRIDYYLSAIKIDVIKGSNELIAYKEALIMAFIAVLRWREENNVIHTVTGARNSSIGGALWSPSSAGIIWK